MSKTMCLMVVKQFEWPSVMWHYVGRQICTNASDTSHPRRLGSIHVWPADVHVVAFLNRQALLWPATYLEIKELKNKRTTNRWQTVPLNNIIIHKDCLISISKIKVKKIPGMLINLWKGHVQYDSHYMPSAVHNIHTKCISIHCHENCKSV
jgi:hypothetical protein